jgi:hypothetical protein
MSAHPPPAHESNPPDHARLELEVRLERLASQVAVVRTLADNVETLARLTRAGGLEKQLVEEMARLGCRLLETAATLAALPEASSEESGVFARSASTHAG